MKKNKLTLSKTTVYRFIGTNSSSNKKMTTEPSLPTSITNTHPSF